MDILTARFPDEPDPCTGRTQLVGRVHTAEQLLSRLHHYQKGNCNMSIRFKRTIAAVCAVAAVCTSFGTTSVLPDFRTGTAVVASAAVVGQQYASGDCSGASIYESTENYQLYYKISGSSAVVTGCRTNKAYTVVNIPKQLGNRNVTSIAANAFKGQVNITRVNFSGSNGPFWGWNSYNGNPYPVEIAFVGGSAISEIGAGAFEGCTNLEQVYAGGNALKVGNRAFYGCKELWEMTFNSANSSNDKVFGDIGEYAFAGCGLSSLQGVKAQNVGSHAFDGCSKLRSVDIIAKTIRGYCFLNCGSIRSLNIKADHIGYHSFEDAKQLMTATIDSPEIGEWAFSGCSALNKLTLINTVRINRHAFQYCGELKTVDIPKTVEFIGSAAFYEDAKLAMPLFFMRENGKPLTIDAAAFYNTGIEYVVLSGNITTDYYAFRNGKMRAVIVEGNVTLDSRTFGGNPSASNPKMTIYGNTNTSPCPNAPYVKVDKSKAYDTLMEKVKPYFMGIQAGPNRFAHDGGCCAGIAIIQNLAMSDRLSFAEQFPMPYKGQPVTSFLQVPDDAYTARRPEFQKFTDDVYEYWDDQYDYLDFDCRLKIDRDTLDAYAKLTEYGVPLPGYVEIKPRYNHAFTFLGIEKLQTPVTKTNGVDGTTSTYNYRMIISENGYRFKTDADGKLIARGNDRLTWWQGISADEGWIPVEDTYIYINANDDTLPWYAQRWHHPQNVKDDYVTLGLDAIKVIPATAVSKKAD